MAWLLILGAIPSGLSGLAHNVQSFYVLRFFIGILGATFVPCQAWTSAFFDTSCVGTANALVAGWGKYDKYLSSNYYLYPVTFFGHARQHGVSWGRNYSKC
jgi:nitrate/nitrite transporter NarK